MKYFVLLSILISIRFANAQSYHKLPTLFDDNKALNKVVDSLKQIHQLDAYVFLQKKLLSDKIISYLVCNLKSASYLWIISSDKIAGIHKLNAKSVFSYKNIGMTGALNEEDHLKFKVPMLGPEDNDLIVYHKYEPDVKLYFEFGGTTEPVSYRPFSDREPFRKEWYDLIKNALAPYMK